MRGGVTDAGRTTEQTLKIELLSQWKLEAESPNILTLIILCMIIIAEVLEGRGWTWGVVPCNDNRLFLFMARLPKPCRDTLVIIIVKNTDLIF